MKKLIIANCILAVALIFSFCTKPEMEDTLTGINTDQVASNRAVCTITNIPPVNTANLTFCGVSQAGAPCLDCNNNAAVGSITFNAGVPVNFNVTTPITFSLRANKRTSVNLSAGNGNTGWIVIPQGGCQRYTVDDNCNITAVQ